MSIQNWNAAFVFSELPLNVWWFTKSTPLIKRNLLTRFSHTNCCLSENWTELYDGQLRGAVWSTGIVQERLVAVLAKKPETTCEKKRQPGWAQVETSSCKCWISLRFELLMCKHTQEVMWWVMVGTQGNCNTQTLCHWASNRLTLITSPKMLYLWIITSKREIVQVNVKNSFRSPCAD